MRRLVLFAGVALRTWRGRVGMLLDVWYNDVVWQKTVQIGVDQQNIQKIWALKYVADWLMEKVCVQYVVTVKCHQDQLCLRGYWTQKKRILFDCCSFLPI